MHAQEWFDQVEDSDSVLDSLDQPVSDRFRQFARNVFTREVQYATAKDLRNDYMGICEQLVALVGVRRAAIVLEEMLKPSYIIQKERFQLVEV